MLIGKNSLGTYGNWKYNESLKHGENVLRKYEISDLQVQVLFIVWNLNLIIFIYYKLGNPKFYKKY